MFCTSNSVGFGISTATVVSFWLVLVSFNPFVQLLCIFRFWVFLLNIWSWIFFTLTIFTLCLVTDKLVHYFDCVYFELSICPTFSFFCLSSFLALWGDLYLLFLIPFSYFLFRKLYFLFFLKYGYPSMLKYVYWIKSNINQYLDHLLKQCEVPRSFQFQFFFS